MAIVKSKKADLNIHYKKYFQISLIITLFLLIAAFKFSPKNKILQIEPLICEWIPIENIVATKQPPKPPELKRPELPQFTISETPEDIEIGNIEITNEVDYFIPPPPVASHLIIEDENEYVFIEDGELPSIIGGLESIAKNIHYTEIAKRIGIEGKVYIKALVNKVGDVEKVEIVKGILPELDEIALNAVKIAKFNPGMQRGKPVKVWITIPIAFQLK
jgi:periplasmic protein TonB